MVARFSPDKYYQGKKVDHSELLTFSAADRHDFAFDSAHFHPSYYLDGEIIASKRSTHQTLFFQEEGYLLGTAVRHEKSQGRMERWESHRRLRGLHIPGTKILAIKAI